MQIAEKTRIEYQILVYAVVSVLQCHNGYSNSISLKLIKLSYKL